MSEFKDNWINALRSGEYSQSRFKLKDSRGYCCLGVAAAVAGEKFVECKPTSLDPEDNPIFKIASTHVDTVYAGPNNELSAILVLNPVTFKEVQIITALTGLNDDHKWTFEQIADWLETIDF